MDSFQKEQPSKQAFCGEKGCLANPALAGFYGEQLELHVPNRESDLEILATLSSITENIHILHV